MVEKGAEDTVGIKRQGMPAMPVGAESRGGLALEEAGLYLDPGLQSLELGESKFCHPALLAGCPRIPRHP